MKPAPLLLALTAGAALTACLQPDAPPAVSGDPALLVTMVGCASCERALERLSGDPRVIAGRRALRVVVLADEADIAAACSGLPAAVPCSGDGDGALSRSMDLRVLPVFTWGGRRAQGDAVDVEIERYLWASR